VSRLRAAGAIDAFIDTYGEGYVKLAVEELGISPDRVDTIADFPAVQEFGVRGEGSAAASSAEVVAEVAALVDKGELEVPIAETFSLDDVRAAYARLESGHIRGKVVLLP
jgi:NADPH:quinone reductase-like Zn-dependent oxidoreductase